MEREAIRMRKEKEKRKKYGRTCEVERRMDRVLRRGRRKKRKKS